MTNLLQQAFFKRTLFRIYLITLGVTLLSLALPWIEVSGLMAMFGASGEIEKIIGNIKQYLVLNLIFTIGWALGCIYLNAKTLKYATWVNVIFTLFFMYVAFVTIPQSSMEQDKKTTSTVVMLIYGLLYLLPLWMGLKNNLKSVMVSALLNSIIIFLVDVVMNIYLKDDKMAMVLTTKFGLTLHLLLSFIVLVLSIMVLIKLPKTLHFEPIKTVSIETEQADTTNPDTTI